jgi:hypothetical protein
MTRKLDRLNGSNDKGTAFQRLWQRNCETVEANFTDISGLVADLAAQLALITAAQNTANTAVTNAATAQTSADTVKRDDAISTSWTSPGTILSATDAGSNATITIANHTRKYTDATSKSVTGSSITGLAYSTSYAVYYDQTLKSGRRGHLSRNHGPEHRPRQCRCRTALLRQDHNPGCGRRSNFGRRQSAFWRRRYTDPNIP